MMTVPEFVSRIMDMPFVPRGRDYDGGDCWAVVWLFWRDVLGCDLPKYDTGYTTACASPVDRDAVSGILRRERVAWTKVDDPQLGDVVALRSFGQACHVGVMLDSARFLHLEKRQGAAVESLSSPLWKRRCDGVYRLVK